VLDRPADSAAPLESNYRGVLGSCFFGEFALGPDALEVQPDLVGRRVEQLGHLILCDTDRIVLEAHLTVRGLIEDDLAAVVLGSLIHAVLARSWSRHAAQGCAATP
jgi:hypothetical protein